MKAIFKKDILSYFHSYIGWLFIGVLWFFVSLYVSGYSFIGQNSSVVGAFSIAEIVLMILLPILTMRTFADEKRQRTDQLIYTAPISIGKVVLGKFLAVGAIYSIPVAALCIYPLILSRFGSVSYPYNYTAIFGLWLYGLACISICVFASSLTESPVIAAVLSFLFLLLTYLVPMITSMISRLGNLATDVMSIFDLVTRFESFLKGTFDLRSVLYLLTVIFVFLFLTVQVIQKSRYVVSKKTFSLGAYSSVMIVVVLALAVILNLGASQLPEDAVNYDVTSQRLYSITDDTREVLNNLDEDITIHVLVAEADQDATVGKTLSRIASASSGHVTIHYVDPAVDPTFMKQYTSASNIYLNSLVVEAADKYRVINYPDLYQRQSNVFTGETTTTGYDAEGQVISAIAYVTADTKPKLYILTGHGENKLDEQFVSAFNKLNIDYADLNLLLNESVPEDAQAVMIYCPRTDLSEDDTAKLIRYADGGGDLIAVTCFESEGEMKNFSDLLAHYGVTAEPGLVLDSDYDNYYQAEVYLLPNVLYDETITKSILQANGFVFVPYAQALTHGESTDSIKYTDLLKTSGEAYIHSNANASTTDFAATENDEKKAYPVGVRADLLDDNGEVRSTGVFYSSLFVFTASADQQVSGSNTKLFNGTISAVTDGDVTISIPVKTFTDDKLMINARTARRLTFLFAAVIPVIVLLVGFVMWLKRRRK